MGSRHYAGTEGMVINETEMNSALPELVRVTDNETKNYEECGYCDAPGEAYGCLGALGGSGVVKVSQGKRPGKGEI